MSDQRRSRAAAATAIALVACGAGWLATTSLQQDFAAYWVAGAACRAGLDPYVNHVGGAAAPELWDGVAVFAHSRFLYPPVFAELFRAFALLPYAASKALFTALLVAAWAVALARMAASSRAALTWGVGALAYPVWLALERGQVDLFVLALLVVGLDAAARPGRAGAALAVATALKPGLLLVLAVVGVLGRVRTVVWALVGLAAVAAVSVATAGPRLAREYATVVLPRAALYGEGGDESMLLPGERLAAHAEDLASGTARVDGRVYRQAAWDGPASASLPRLLAPDGPTRLATRAPALALLALLLVAAAIVRHRGTPAGAAALQWAAAVAAVVASPAGWVMGLVFALPLAPWLARTRELSPAAKLALGAALLASLCPPPVAGWAALAGTALVVLTTSVAAAAPRVPA